jgi:soluble lytic murein transglycosylase-like protein
MNSSQGRKYAVAACGMVAVCAWIAAGAQAEGLKIYRSYDAHSRAPTFSDQPLNRTSQVFATFDGNRLWPRAGTGPVTLAELAARRTTLEPAVQRIAAAYGVHAALLKAIIEVESGFDPHAVSNKGAIGLMQVLPETAARYGSFDLYAAEQNVEAGARYLHDLLARFDGDVRLAIAAYNAGENAVLRYGRRVPPYAETMKYVPMVMERYRHFQAHTAQ